MNISKTTQVKLIKCFEYDENQKTPYNIIHLQRFDQDGYCFIFKITGDINTSLCFCSDFGNKIKNIAYIDENHILYAAFGSNIIKYDLNTNTLIKNIIDGEWIHNFFILNDGFLLHQEQTVKYFDTNLNLLWKNTDCVDIFGNILIKKNYEIGKDYIAIIDWYGYKHYFNCDGKFKVEQTKYIPKE